MVTQQTVGRLLPFMIGGTTCCNIVQQSMLLGGVPHCVGV
jgi:hypothetical protein